MFNTFLALLQHAIPKRRISDVFARLARSRVKWIRWVLIRWFARTYKVDMSSAARPQLDAYASFEDFFTRELVPGARPMPLDASAIVCPADGTVSAAGHIEDGCLIQAKGHRYALSELIQEDGDAYVDGTFATIYLAPHSYHRVHSPVTGSLTRTVSVPGELFSVNENSDSAIKNLYCRNERLVCTLDTELGPVVLVMVGALIVSGIHTAWHHHQTPYGSVEVDEYRSVGFQRGDEMARFTFGSTVILIVPPQVGKLTRLVPGQPVYLRRPIGVIHASEETE